MKEKAAKTKQVLMDFGVFKPRAQNVTPLTQRPVPLSYRNSRNIYATPLRGLKKSSCLFSTSKSIAN